MGEQINYSLDEGLAYVPIEEFQRIVSHPNKAVRAALLATLSRINALYMIARAGSGHIGSSFSSLDILSWLHLEEMQKDDIFFSSKGHDAPGYYALMIGLERLAFDNLHLLRRAKGLPGHPDIHVPVCVTNTGSLGMGISKAKGMLYARRHLNQSGRIFVMTGDGELQEGQIWESLFSAAQQKLSDLMVIVDHNKLQSDTFVSATSDLGDLVKKFEAFGWYVERCDGHNFSALQTVFSRFNAVRDKPKILIADTIKGCGVSFMEHTSLDSDVALYRFHSGAPDSDSYKKALSELIAAANHYLNNAGLPLLQLTMVDEQKRAKPLPSFQRLINAYSKALIQEAHQNQKIIALDADLVLDTGLIPFQTAFPERFVECGIAEQDMVSQAGGMALQGLLPIVHSFACFLSARPNEQIYNNATEQTRIVYVGSLAGVVPGGPGHSHQAVRDIAALNGIPDFEMLEPSCEQEVAMIVDYCFNHAKQSSYIRLVSIPCDIPYQLPKNYRLEVGKGVVLRQGSDVVIFAYGPILLAEAWKAAENLDQRGIKIRLVNLPWLNKIDLEWLISTVSGCRAVLTLDNHQIAGGQGERITAGLSFAANSIPILQKGIHSIPAYGTNEEVLQAHSLNAAAIEAAVIEIFSEVHEPLSL